MRGALLQAASLAGFSEHDAQQMTLAVDEGCTNIIKYSYGGDCSKRIILSCYVVPGGIEIRIRDFGKKSDPDQIKSRQLSDVRPGGLGVYLMHEIMDIVEYDHSKKVGTELRMVKKIKNRLDRDKTTGSEATGSHS
jgi:anti-sigma regulatory factor (Ser/Thr protein kinase)